MKKIADMQAEYDKLLKEKEEYLKSDSDAMLHEMKQSFVRQSQVSNS